MILQTSFKWVRNPSRNDKLRNKGYPIAVVTLILTYILKIVDLILRRANAIVPHNYLCAFVFSDGLWRIADILILAIIYRTIAESSSSNLARRLFKWHRAIIVLVALDALATWIFYTVALMVLVTEQQGRLDVKTESMMLFTYQGLYLPAALLAGLESWLVASQARSEVSLPMAHSSIVCYSQLTIQTRFMMLSAFVSALILHSIFVVLHNGLIWYNEEHYQRLALSTTSDEDEVFKSTPYYIQWVLLYLSEITNIFIYGGVVLIGWLSFRQGAIKRSIQRPTVKEDARALDDVSKDTELQGR
jgi:hypothetical protein